MRHRSGTGDAGSFATRTPQPLAAQDAAPPVVELPGLEAVLVDWCTALHSTWLRHSAGRNACAATPWRLARAWRLTLPCAPSTQPPLPLPQLPTCIHFSAAAPPQ